MHKFSIVNSRLGSFATLMYCIYTIKAWEECYLILFTSTVSQVEL